MPAARLQFLPDWRAQQQGTIDRGGTLTIEYDKSRLSPCFAEWHDAELGDIVAYCRFHPRGDVITGSVVAASRPLALQVPLDSTDVELWFQNFSQTSTRCDAWDSRFGQNYWFGVGGPPPRLPFPAVSYRAGARTRPDMVNVLSQQATKLNAFASNPSRGSAGTDLQSRLDLAAWVRETKYGANAWIDLHVFDGGDQLIHGDTVTLPYAGFGPMFRYGFSDVVYQGSVATPGSVDPRPDARTLQYRLYYEVDYQVFTDGILHQLDLPEDAAVMNWVQAHS
jgi:hypothetical protein